MDDGIESGPQLEIQGYEEYAAENLRLSEANLGAAFTNWAVLDPREQKVMDDIVLAYHGLLDLGLIANQGEAEAAVHVLQNMVAHRMLQRNGNWGDWFDLDYVPDDATIQS